MFIQRKGGKDKPLPETQEKRNRRIAKRAPASSLCSQDWRNWAARRCAASAWRATLHLNWKAATYNLRRLCYLKEAPIEAF